MDNTPVVRPLPERFRRAQTSCAGNAWMRRSWALLLCCGLFAGSALRAAEEQPSQVADTALGQLLRPFTSADEAPLDTDALLAGDVVLRLAAMDDDTLLVRGWVLIEASRKQVWDVLLDCDQALDYVPNMRACEVLASGIGDDGHRYDITHHRVKPYFFLPAVDNLFRATYMPPARIRFAKAGGDLVRFAGNWWFHALGRQRTLLCYQARVDLRASVSARGERYMVRKDVSEMLRRLKRQAERAAARHADVERAD